MILVFTSNKTSSRCFISGWYFLCIWYSGLIYLESEKNSCYLHTLTVKGSRMWFTTFRQFSPAFFLLAKASSLQTSRRISGSKLICYLPRPAYLAVIYTGIFFEVVNVIFISNCTVLTSNFKGFFCFKAPTLRFVIAFVLQTLYSVLSYTGLQISI